MSSKFIEAINEGNIDEVKTLLDELGYPFLDHSIENLLKHVMKSDTPAKNEIFDYIVEHTKYDFSIRDIHYKSTSPLMKFVCGCQSVDDLRMVLKHVDETDIDICDDEDESALYMAVKHYHDVANYGDNSDETISLCKNIIIELLKHNANPLLSFDIKSPVKFMIEYGMFDLLEIFVQHSKHDISFNAIYYSILIGNYDFVEYLIDRVDMNQVKNRRTLLEYAMDIGAGEDIIELLRTSL